MTKPVSIGNLSSDLLQVGTIAIHRMRQDPKNEWLLWRDDEGELYFSETSQAGALKVMQNSPDMRICTYRHTPQYRVKATDILEDLQDAAETQRQSTIEGVAA